MRTIDLFAGMGGLALGFAEEGFDVLGVDINKCVPPIFALNRIGEALVADLSRGEVSGRWDLVLGGPPCRPWATINVAKREKDHPDHVLIEVYFDIVSVKKPVAFILENVLAARRAVESALGRVRTQYDVRVSSLRYSDFGAPTKRRRLFAVGLRRDTGVTAEDFFSVLGNFRAGPRTVRDAIFHLRKIPEAGEEEHVYLKFRTIERYRRYYATGQFGWYILRWDEPAPSFGSIRKTYILHPDSTNGMAPRVLSVREAMCVMGFPESFRFPEGVSITMKYQMIADAVSPVVSRSLARALRQVLK